MSDQSTQTDTEPQNNINDAELQMLKQTLEIQQQETERLI